jgi:phosphatidylglycerophosphate synthase
MSSVQTLPGGAKKRDYWWTVLVIDPLAVPLARFVAARRLLSPDQITWLSAAVGLPIGIAFGWGSRWGLIVGAVLFYLSFMLDCVDGKVARTLGAINPNGKSLDDIADGVRRASASLGLAVYLWKEADPNGSDGRFFWAVVFGLLSSYFFSLASSNARAQPESTGVPAESDSWLARHRLLARPGGPDVGGIVFVIGPLFGWVVPCLAIGCALMAAGVITSVLRLVRR